MATRIHAYAHMRAHTDTHRRTSLRVVLGDVGLRQVIDNLFFENLGVVDEQLGPLVHQILGDVDAGRLPATVAQTHILVSGWMCATGQLAC